MNDTGRTILTVIVAIIALPLLWGGMMGGMGPGMMWGWNGADRWGAGWGFLMMVPGLLIFAAIIAALVWGFGRGSSAPPSTGAPTARDLLDARYAHGEITREQYQQMRADLGS